jgi:hypothetical protein
MASAKTSDSCQRGQVLTVLPVRDLFRLSDGPNDFLKLLERDINFGDDRVTIISGKNW